MRKSMLNLVLLLAATAPIGATAGWAGTTTQTGWLPGYATIYFSDASMSEEVARTHAYCTRFGPAETHVPDNATPYSTRVMTLWCDEDGYEHPI